MIRLLKWLDRSLARVELTVAILAVAGLVAILIAQVFYRYVLLSPLFFAEELAVRLMIVATFVGLSLLAAENRLVSVDLIGTAFGPVAHKWAVFLIRLVVLALGAILAFYAFRYLSQPYVWIERSATLNMPRATIYTVFAVEMTALCFHQLVRVLDTPPWAVGSGGEA